MTPALVYFGTGTGTVRDRIVLGGQTVQRSGSECSMDAFSSEQEEAFLVVSDIFGMPSLYTSIMTIDTSSICK